MAAVIEEARGVTRSLVELPTGEGVVLEIVRDKSWLCQSYVAGDPGRFRRLLTEQVRVGDLLEAREAGARASTGP